MDAPNYTDDSIERIQSAHRRRIVESWDIPAGARILEVGCGQGDLTVALAEAVGPTGHVTGIDIAPRTYGAPLNLGEATDRILAGPLGDRTSFHFELDLRSASFAPASFDIVAFAHSSWYFSSLDELRETLVAAHRLAPRLAFAEWDIEPHSFDQVAHLLAVMIQGQVEAFRTTSEANIRTPFTRSRFKELLRETGWVLTTESTIDSRAMQEADWEIAACQHGLKEVSSSLNLPPKAQQFLDAQLEILRVIAAVKQNASLDTFSILANH